MIVAALLGALTKSAFTGNHPKSLSMLCISASILAVSDRKTSDEMRNGYR
jgi:hypothetical protein